LLREREAAEVNPSIDSPKLKITEITARLEASEHRAL
jgi:hypothetical protein